ncbi:hypothetical protein [Tolypothrix sp. VBCCA 56010]|uniref:hypothetical protein n=1 Tax=Tolypothrix sp. VBCCA 56010 TaxID=3137731 RepID=UPI003D7C86EE
MGNGDFQGGKEVHGKGEKNAFPITNYHAITNYQFAITNYQFPIRYYQFPICLLNLLRLDFGGFFLLLLAFAT